MERTRYTLPEFASQAVWKPGNRFEFTTGVGGVNAWKPDNTLIEHTRQTSYNDAWLGEVWLTGKFAVDAKKRLWLGIAVRAMRDMRQSRQDPSHERWTSFSVTATYYFGR